MQPLAIDAALVRAVLTPDLKLAVGRELMARVATLAGDGRGTLNLAGVPLPAELPDNVKAGDELRLVVRELTPDKVVLAIQEDAGQAQPPPPLVDAPLVPMPQGGSVQITDRDAASGQRGEGTHTLTLRYDAAAFGPIDMTFTLSSGALRLALTVPQGSSYTAADGAATGLVERLTDATAAHERDRQPASRADRGLRLMAAEDKPGSGVGGQRATNPAERKTATALSYEHGDTAPQVVATGIGYVAEQMIAAAREAGVPVRSDPALAKALAASDLGDQVPEALYRAVAETLAWAHGLDNEAAKRSG
jgi:flagellar biosynthesis protein